MCDKRDIPADFIDIAPSKSLYFLRRHYNAGPKTIIRWLKEANIELSKSPPIAPPPKDLAQKAKVMFKYELISHYKVGVKTINRWLIEANIGKLKSQLSPSNKIDTPNDLPQMAKSMCVTELSRHYGYCANTIRRWLREIGITAAIPKQQRPAAFQRNPNEFANKVTDLRKHTIYDQAADILRRERWVVYPCDTNGAYTLTGKSWRVGSMVIDGEELLARAEKYRRKGDDNW